MSQYQEITMVVAASENNVIGNKGKIPWYIPDDIKRFKRLTTGFQDLKKSENIVEYPVVMGRKTAKSIHDRLGKYLPYRRNIIMSRTMEKPKGGYYVARDDDEAFMLMGGKNSFIIGGSQIYELFYPYVNKIELTRVHSNFEGDTFLPYIDWDDWNLTNSESSKTEKGLEYSFLTYEPRYLDIVP